MSELSLYLFNVLCTLIIFFSTRDCEPFSKSKIHGFFKREIQKNPFVSAALISHVLQPLMVYMWTASSFTGVSQRQNNTISPASQPTNCFYSIWGSNWCHGLVAPYFSDRWSHIRKKKKDRRKGKGRRSVWGEECIQFIAVLAILPRTIMKNRLNASFFSNHPGAIHPIFKSSSAKQLARQGDDLCLFFCLYPSSMNGVHTHELDLLDSLHFSNMHFCLVKKIGLWLK